MPNRKGFTLVEVIVVLVILAILAAILVPTLTGYIDRANEKSETVGCRAAVQAAQALATENYGSVSAVTPEGVKALAELTGTVSDLEIDPDNSEVLHVTYKGNLTVTFCRYPDTCPQHSQTYTYYSTAPWKSGEQYNSGDIVTVDGLRFECIRTHTAGSTSATRNPTVGANKSTWCVVGYEDGADKTYSSIYRYAPGVQVVYRGVTYERTDYLPSGGQTPFDGSAYWNVVTP